MSLKELKKVLTEKVIIGSEETIKKLKQGKTKKVFLASNCREDVKARIKRYAQLGNIEIYELEETNRELGTLCKKSYAISVISV